MEGVWELVLEPLRPSYFRKGDYSFVWIYLGGMLLIYFVYCKLSQYIETKRTFSRSRVSKCDSGMQAAWLKKQEQLGELPAEEPKPREESKRPPERVTKPYKAPKSNPFGMSNLKTFRPSIRDRYPCAPSG